MQIIHTALWALSWVNHLGTDVVNSDLFVDSSSSYMNATGTAQTASLVEHIFLNDFLNVVLGTGGKHLCYCLSISPTVCSCVWASVLRPEATDHHKHERTWECPEKTVLKYARKCSTDGGHQWNSNICKSPFHDAWLCRLFWINQGCFCFPIPDSLTLELNPIKYKVPRVAWPSWKLHLLCACWEQ